uniref:Si:dkey-78k11.9 n=1 Tax=Neogobius melanostomus TaxID=47308 RepID=A0A8C6USN7_9GOBI
MRRYQEHGHSIHCILSHSALVQLPHGTSALCWSGANTTVNRSSCPSVNFTFTDRFLPPVYILVFIVGLLANMCGLKFLLKNWKKVGPVNVFLFNLGLADILYLLTLPFLMVSYLHKERKWIFGDAFCKITRFCFGINLYGSIGFLTCISVFRYLSIVHPMRVRGRLTSTRSVVISLVVWLLVCAKCFDTTSDDYIEDYLKYSVGWTITGFCLPFLVTVGCYAHVIVTLCRSSSTDRLLKQRSYKLLLVLLLLFSVCYIPYHVLRILNLWSRVLRNRGQCYSWFNTVYVSKQVSRSLVCLNSALNPLVYLHVSEGLSSQLRTLLSRTQSAFSGISSTLSHLPNN